MLQSLKDFLAALAPRPEPPAAAEHRLRLAVAVLLVEVMRSDSELAPAEQAAVQQALQTHFTLAADEAGRLAALAHQAAREAGDFHAFTSALNEAWDTGQKLQMIESLWRVAYADGHLAAHEQHVMRRLADLLHVPHGGYIHAKMRAKPAA